MADEPKKWPEHFPTTRDSAILGAKSKNPEERARSLELIALAYWKPVYKYTRFRFGKSPEETEDITQDFFAKALERGTFGAYDPARARFRAFLRTCLDRFVLDYERVRTAKKRGGRSERFHLEFGEAEREIAAAQPPRPDALDAYFESEWTRHLLSLAVETLRREFEEKGKAKQFRVFERYHVQDASDPPAYAQVAAELGITVTDVTNWLTQTRREFRRIVLETLQAMTGSDEEYRSEALAVLGVVA